MGVLGRVDGRCKASELAAELDSTSGFIPQVLNPLVKAGWVASDPGPSGGYRLVADLDRVSVLEVVEAIDGPTDDGRCVVANQPCDGLHPCALHVAWSLARAELTDALRHLPLSHLTSSPATR